MVTIHKPNSVQITVDSLMAHYDRAKRKQEQAASQRPERAQRRAGGREGREGGEAREERRRQKLAALYQATLTEAEGLAEPLSMWQRFSLDEVAELAPWLPERSAAVTFGLCTLGPALDEYMRTLSESDMSAASVLNEIALAWIVGLTQEIHQTVRAEVTKLGLKAGPPYRPGLGKWPLESQKTLFDRLPTSEIGVRLTDSYLMLPSFSTSLIIPITEKIPSSL